MRSREKISAVWHEHRNFSSARDEEKRWRELTRNSHLLTVAGDATARSFTSNWKQLKKGIRQKQEFIAILETLKGEVRCNRL